MHAVRISLKKTIHAHSNDKFDSDKSKLVEEFADLEITFLVSEDKDKAPESREPEAHIPEASTSEDALLDKDWVSAIKEAQHAGMHKTPMHPTRILGKEERT